MSDSSLSAEQFFSKVTSAIRSGDSSAVDDVMKTEVNFEPKVEPEVVATPEAEAPTVAATPAPTPAAAPAEPAAASTAPTPSTEPVATHPTTPAASDEDWKASLSDEVRAKVEQLEQQHKEAVAKADRAENQWRSNAQRMPAYQRTIANLTSKLADLEPLARKLPAASIDKDEDLKRIAEHDPELAKTIGNFQQRREAELAKAFDSRVKEVVAPIATEIDQAYVMEQNSIVRDHISNLDQVLQDQWFQGWLNHQKQVSPNVYRLFESPHAADALRLMEIYGSDVKRYHEARAASQPAPVAQPVATTVPTPRPTTAAPSPEDIKAQQIMESRNRRVTATAAPSSSPPPVNLRSAQPESEEALNEIFKKAFNETNKQFNPTRK